MSVPVQVRDAMKSRDSVIVAVQVFKDLDQFRPTVVPQWGTIQPPLACAIARSDACAENVRKLRASVWCEHVFRRSAPTADFAGQMMEFHRHYWRIARVENEGTCDELGNRKSELQIAAAVRLLAHPITAQRH